MDVGGPTPIPQGQCPPARAATTHRPRSRALVYESTCAVVRSISAPISRMRSSTRRSSSSESTRRAAPKNSICGAISRGWAPPVYFRKSLQRSWNWNAFASAAFGKGGIQTSINFGIRRVTRNLPMSPLLWRWLKASALTTAHGTLPRVSETRKHLSPAHVMPVNRPLAGLSAAWTVRRSSTEATATQPRQPRRVAGSEL